MSADSVDHTRRRFLTTAAGAVGGVGALYAAVPFVASMQPSARAQAAGAPVEVDISKLNAGEMLKAEWRGKPVWVLRRTPEMLESLKKVEAELADPGSENINQQPDYARNAMRSIKPEYLVLVGICTHLGCSPTSKLEAGDAAVPVQDWQGGFFCPCHGSAFDLAGRVYKDVPAPSNLPVPPHRYVGDTHIVIGEDQEGAA